MKAKPNSFQENTKKQTEYTCPKLDATLPLLSLQIISWINQDKSQRVTIRLKAKFSGPSGIPSCDRYVSKSTPSSFCCIPRTFNANTRFVDPIASDPWLKSTVGRHAYFDKNTDNHYSIGTNLTVLKSFHTSVFVLIIILFK